MSEMNSGSPQVSNLGGVKVLIVDDSADNQTLMKIILTKLGASVEVASNGREGADAALRTEFDVVLMDLQMPIMDGHEATRALRAQGYNKPIVALTAHAMKEERDRAKESGFSDYLTKPVQKEALKEMILRLTATSASGQK